MLLALRFLYRDFFSAHAKELRLLLLALIVAVAAVTAVGFFTNRVGLALEQESHQMLGADLLLIADRPWSQETHELIGRHGLHWARTQTFMSMVFFDGRAQLVDVKAVSEGYPLRGRLRTAARLGGDDADNESVPPPGQAWIDERLALSLSLEVGDILDLGKARLRVTAILTYEPDRSLNVFNIAMRLMINEADLAATDLIKTGSRVAYRLLVAGDAGKVASFRNDLLPLLQRGQRVEDANNARPEIRTALDRADRFLGLASMLTVIMALVAVALTARRYLQRHLDICAVMRCLGATQAYLLKLYLVQFTVLGSIAVLLGSLGGFGAHFILYGWLAEFLDVNLPSPSLRPLWQGACVGLLLLFGFAVPPLFQLRRVATLRVLRRELGAPRPALLGGYLLGLFALLALLLWVADDVRLGLYTAGGFCLASLVFMLCARTLVALAKLIPRRGASGWRHGLSGLARRPWAASLQITALALGFMAILLLTVTRDELIEAWRRAAPAEVPNRFVINIQPEQRQAVADFFKENAIEAELSPMIRGRLAAINERAVSAADYKDERSQRLVEREFNLSMRADLPPQNTVSAGRWFTEQDLYDLHVCSVEEGLARSLGIKVGDRLRFVVASEPVEMTVIGLRKLNWDSMQVNFFVLTPPELLDDYPQSFITSLYLPPGGSEEVTARLIQAFPNLTMIDVSAVIAQIERIMDQVARAVQFIFIFTLAAAVIVLNTMLTATFDERSHELAMMRALGARAAQIRQVLLAEFAAIGALAGLVAALGSIICGIVLARQIFHLVLHPDYVLLLLSMAAGMVIVVVGCAPGVYHLLRTPPVQMLRMVQ